MQRNTLTFRKNHWFLINLTLSEVYLFVTGKRYLQGVESFLAAYFLFMFKIQGKINT